MAYTIPQIINYASVCQSYSIADIAKSGLDGGGIDLQLPRKIYCIRKNLQWIYTLDNNDSTITGTANYLIALCGKYFLKASNSTGGGSVSPISPIIIPNPIEFEVTSNSLIPIGGSTLNIPSFKGFNLLFIRGGIPQGQINLGGSYFTWNKVTGDFSCIGAAADQEFFQLYPFI